MMGKVKIRNAVALSVFLVFILMLSFVFGCTVEKEVADTKDTNLMSSLNSTAQPEEQLICPKGIGSEPAPGTCPLYIDENNDGYCDFK